MKTKKAICEELNVSTKSFERFLKTLDKDMGKSEGSSHEKVYPDEIKDKFKKWLANNQLSQGRNTGAKDLINAIKFSGK